MPARNSRGRFVKRSTTRRRHHRRHHTRRRRSRAVARSSSTRTVYVQRRRGSRRRHSSGGGLGLKHLALAGAGLAFLAGPATPVKAITDNVAKIPGAKTFGNVAIAGMALGALDHFVLKRRNKWMRAAGAIGVALAAVQVGTKGKDFSWVGDEGGYLEGGQYQVEGFDDDEDDGDENA